MALELAENDGDNFPCEESFLVDVKGKQEEVFIDPEKGPLVYTLDGNYTYFLQNIRPHRYGPVHKHGFCAARPWTGLSPSQQYVVVDQAARKNVAMREFKGKEFFANAHLPTKRQIAVANYAMGASAKLKPEFSQAEHQRPVLCIWYSGGLDPTQGREQMEKLVNEARQAGLQHVLVMDYPDTYGITGQGSAPWCRYVEYMVKELDSDPDRRQRPVILLGHSRGATPAMTMAAKLGDRVLKVYCLSSGAPVPGYPSPFQQMSAFFRAMRDIDLLRWFCSMNPVPLLVGVMKSVEDGTMTIYDSPFLTEKVALMKRQYVNTCWPDMKKDFIKIHAPILVVAGKKDETVTTEAAELWKEWTSKSAKVKSLDCGHMETAGFTDVLIADMVQLRL